MPRYFLELAYDGSPFCGWQVQPTHQRGMGEDPRRERISIQEQVQNAIQEITGEPNTVIASGRTDAGVHAIRQCAHVDLRRAKLSVDRLRGGLNAKLPTEVRVLRVLEVTPEFHARFSAGKKEYAYYLSVGLPLPHLARYVWFLPRDIDLKAMNEALRAVVGEHDFVAFQGRRAGTESTVRRIFSAKVQGVKMPLGSAAPLYRISLVGSGFLKQMVRSIVGTVVEVGLGIRPPKDLERLLTERNRRSVGKTAPGHGLWLERVWYPRRFGI